ncbi:MAG: hypothetical protein JXL85_03205 [Bacilli bacterium]|nr:hypothetical protein [Bacilli bacterium]
MKKLVLLLFGLIFAVAMIGCNNGSEISVDLDAFIAAPTGLEITGTVLSWTAVEDANGYIIYANGEEADDTKTTSFDFSSMVEARLIFQVRTKAPRGMQDSALSASVAYVANKEAEITDVVTAFQTNGMSVPDAFAEELVNKGMLSSEVEGMLDQFMNFQDDIESASTVEDFYNAINDMLAEVDNVEALVSALVVTYLPDLVESQINDLQWQIDYYLDMIDTYPSYEEYYGPMIDQLQAQLDIMEGLLDDLDNDPDSVVLAITSTVEYFISIEEMISQDLIDTLSSITEASSPSDLNAAELNTVKEELVNILRETMPTQEDMTLIFQVYDILLAISGTTVTIYDDIENYTGRMAVQSLYMMEAYINFLDELDQDYFDEIIGFLTGDLSYEMQTTEIGILTIVYFDQFKSNNQALLDTIAEVFTDEEQETMYNDYIASLGDYYGGDFIIDISFQDILMLRDNLKNAFDAMLDEFVDRDGELLRQITILNSFYISYFDDYGSNSALDEEYDTRREALFHQSLEQIALMEELAYVLQAGLNEMNQEDYVVLTKYIFSTEISSMLLYVDSESPDITVFNSAFDTFMEESADQQFELLTNLVDFALDDDVFAQVNDFVSAMYVKNDYDYEYYATVVLEMQIYDDFMTNANRGLAEDIVGSAATVMLLDDIMSLTELTETQVGDIEDNIYTIIDYLNDEAGTLNGMNYNNLDQNDFDDIDAFVVGLQDLIEAVSDPIN